jgi:hypothetical protein
MLMPDARACVLHVAGMEDEQALETLVRTTQVIATQGVAQVLIALDAGRGGAPLAWPAALAAEVRRLRCAGLTILGKIRALEAEVTALLAGRALYAVHLHGVEPGLLASRALKGRAPGRVLYSPHLTRRGSAWSRALLGRLLQKHLAHFHYAPLATSPTEAQALSRLLNRSAEVLPCPVEDAFFAVPRTDELRPRVLAHGEGAAAVNLVTRLGVLLNGRAARVPFSWLGALREGTLAQLQAAHIPVLEAADDLERARVLSRASAFIHVAASDAFPLPAAQAMAAGVPCLVSDTPAHRALVRHGETGFVCTSERDFVEKLVLLLRDRGERSRLGENARAEAQQRFTARHFESALLRAYGLSARQPAAPRAAGAIQYGYGG